MKISLNKTKTLAFKSKDPIRSKVVIRIEQVNTFHYLGAEVSYTSEANVNKKHSNNRSNKKSHAI